MGIFSRFRDIIHSNLNAMLDKAEDPEKLIKLMIQEMEDTLVEMKASCAGAMANRAKVGRAQELALQSADKWEGKARLAIARERDDLAREALLEKRAYLAEAERCEREQEHFAELIGQYHRDIGQLEEKLEAARNKHRLLIQRHVHASQRKAAQTRIRAARQADAFTRFEQFENRIERMEAEAELVNFRSRELNEQFAELENDERLEAELAELRARVQKRTEKTSPVDAAEDR